MVLQQDEVGGGDCGHRVNQNGFRSSSAFSKDHFIVSFNFLEYQIKVLIKRLKLFLLFLRLM